MTGLVDCRERERMAVRQPHEGERGPMAKRRTAQKLIEVGRENGRESAQGGKDHV